MAHNIYIDRRTKKPAMMFVGETPWHKLGQKLEKPATAKEAINTAGLNYIVEKIPLQLKDKSGLIVPEQFATIRTDKPKKDITKILGVVGSRYTIIQNTEAFSFMDGIVGEEKPIYHTAGALGKGERIWILVKLPGNIQILKDDCIDKFLLLTNTHDGTSGVQVKFTPIRVVCENTLYMALKKGRTLSVPHFKDVKERLEEATEVLGIAKTHFEEVEKSFKIFVGISLNTDAMKKYITNVVPDPEKPINKSRDEKVFLKKLEDFEREQKKVQELRELLLELFENGYSNEPKEVRGTLWAAYNTVTEFVDHYTPEAGNPLTKVRLDRELKDMWFGEGASLKEKAYIEALNCINRN